MSRSVRWAIGVAVVAAIGVSLATLPVGEALLGLVEWARQAGAVGVVAYGVAYVTATLLFVPGVLLTLGAGFVYGPVWGTLLVSPASVIGASLAFGLGRGLARGWIARRVAGNARFEAIDRAIGEAGFRIVLLLRLSPVFPFNALNYGLRLTRVRARPYILASALGMLPGTFLYVYLGSLITSASQLLGGQRPSAGPLGQALYFGGLAATLAVTVLVTRIARRALGRALDGAPGPGKGEVPRPSNAPKANEAHGAKEVRA